MHGNSTSQAFLLVCNINNTLTVNLSVNMEDYGYLLTYSSTRHPFSPCMVVIHWLNLTTSFPDPQWKLQRSRT